MKQTEKALESYLVSSAQTGDRGAMDQLIRLRGPRLLAHAARLLGETEGARDAVQDAWVEIFRGISGLRDTGLFLPWALQIVSRRVVRVIKGRQRDRAIASEYAHEADLQTPEAGPLASDAAKVRQAIGRLPANQAATVALFYLEELGVADVAWAMDVPIGTVKTRLMHARTKLRAELERTCDGKA